MRFFVAAFLAAAYAGLASAYTTPVGQPNGNPISAPGLNQQVVAGKSFTITWNVRVSSPVLSNLVHFLRIRSNLPFLAYDCRHRNYRSPPRSLFKCRPHLRYRFEDP
jgi:hypothetical protein